MDPVKSDVEIQAVNLTQQWYSLPHERLPELADLLTGYLHCFSDPADQQQFLREALRLAEEMCKSPKAETLPEQYSLLLKEELTRRLDS